MRILFIVRHMLLATIAGLVLGQATPAAANRVAVYNWSGNINVPLIVAVRTACITSDAGAAVSGRVYNFGNWQAHQVGVRSNGAWDTPSHCAANSVGGSIPVPFTGKSVSGNLWQALILFVKDNNAYVGVFPLPGGEGLPIDPNNREWGLFPADLVNAVNVLSSAEWGDKCGPTKYCIQFNQGMAYQFAAPITEIPHVGNLLEAINKIPSWIPTGNQIIDELRRAANNPSH